MKTTKSKLPFFALALIMSTGPLFLNKQSSNIHSNNSRSIANATANSSDGLSVYLKDSKQYIKDANLLVTKVKDSKETMDSVKELRVLKNKKLKTLSKKISHLKRQTAELPSDEENRTTKKEIRENIKKVTVTLEKLRPILIEKIDLIQDKVNSVNQEVACQNSNALIVQKEQLEKLLAANEKLEKEKQEKIEKEKKAKEKKVAKAKKRKEKTEKVREYFKNIYTLRTIVSSMMNNYSHTYRQETSYIQYDYGQTYADPISNVFSQPSNFNWLDVLAFQNNNSLTQNPFYQAPATNNHMAINNYNLYPEYTRNETEVDTQNDLDSADI